MKTLPLILGAFLLLPVSFPAGAAGHAAADTGEAAVAGSEIATEEQKAFYFLGSSFGKQISAQLKALNMSAEEQEIFERGFSEAMTGQSMALDEQVYGPKINEIAQERMLASAAEESAASGEYLNQMAAEEGAMTTESGIVVREIVAGTGEMPTSDSTVKAHYHGTLRDGTVFDSSVERGQPFSATLSSVIPCWREAIPMIKVGGKSKITCPAELAYGTNGSPPKIPGGAALTFEVELLEIVN